MSRYIDADKLMNEFHRYAYDTEDLHIDLIEDIVNDEPTADVRENIKACWQIGQSKKSPWRSAMICSNCGFEVCSADKGWNVYIDDHYHYCPNCGADMRGEA